MNVEKIPYPTGFAGLEQPTLTVLYRDGNIRTGINPDKATLDKLYEQALRGEVVEFTMTASANAKFRAGF
jgi:hypothetical protein